MVSKNKKTVLTRQQAIDELVNNVWEWDSDCLVSFVQQSLQDTYKKSPLIDIEADYNTEFQLYEGDDNVTVIDTKASRLLIDGVKK